MAEERVALLDAAGRGVATCVPGERHGRPRADLLEGEPGVATADVVAAVLAQCDGWTVASGVELGDALVAAGEHGRGQRDGARRAAGQCRRRLRRSTHD